MNQRLLLLLLFATSCANGANDVARVMNDTNFEGHNLDHGGCAPVVTSNYTTPALCQHECDNTSGCDMWTFVPAAARHGSVPGPWCCLKSCEIEGGVCPPPNAEQGVVSGVTDPNTYDKCVGPECFTLNVDWSSGNSNPARVLHHPSTANFSVRKLEAFYYPPDGKTYAYADIVNYSSYYYPDSYSTEVGVFSSADGATAWTYHGIVIHRGAAGSWDSGGIASPGAAASDDGTVVVGFCGENSPTGGINRGIGVAIASHPLGPFVKNAVPVASPTGVCGGTGRCDDVIMQSRNEGKELHLYHSVKGGAPPPGDGIRHVVSTDNGKTWSSSELVLSAALQPGHSPAESIAGKYMPAALGGKGAMVLITDGGPGGTLHAYLSKTPGDMVNFVAATQPAINVHPPSGTSVGDWSQLQIGFIPDADGNVPYVTYSLWVDEDVYNQRRKVASKGYTHTVYNFTLN